MHFYNHASYMHDHRLFAEMAYAISGEGVHVESVMQILMFTGVIAGDGR